MDSLQHRTLETISCFYHVTTIHGIHKVLDDGCVRADRTETPYWTQLARDSDSPLGVWFCVSKMCGELPDASLYGEGRLKIPCSFIYSGMLQPRLYLETFFFYEFLPKTQIVRLVLVDAEKYKKEDKWCQRRCLRRLNPHDNKLLVLNRDTNSYRCLENDGRAFPNISVEVLVVGDVATVSMDTVTETAPSKHEAVPGKIPPGIL